MPPRDMFDPDGMYHEKRREFEFWYQEQTQRDVIFNLSQEIKEYCFSGVKLLTAGCQKFREDFIQKAQFDPMEQCITIASACNLY